jgi:glycogen operon protein
VVDDSFLLLFNAWDEAIDWKIADRWGDAWEWMLDTAAGIPSQEITEPVRGSVLLTERSVVLLRRIDADDGG